MPDRLTKDSLYLSQRDYYRTEYESGAKPPWDSAFDQKWLEGLLKRRGPGGRRLALDMGTGHGRGARTLARAGYRVVGVDYVYGAVRKAAAKGGRGILYAQADVFELPFQEEVFDFILDWGVFHHTRRRDARKLTGVVRRLLRKDGRWALGCFSTKFRHEGERKRKRNWTLHKGHYDRFSTKGELVRLFRPGFAINSITEDSGGFYLLDMVVKK